VVALILDAARAAREDAQRLRADSSELRTTARSSARTTQARTVKARAAVATARERAAVAYASPWSSLLWRRDDKALERVLTAVE
jgi:hypothetical protein